MEHAKKVSGTMIDKILVPKRQCVRAFSSNFKILLDKDSIDEYSTYKEY